jgi:hypothetical protein
MPINQANNMNHIVKHSNINCNIYDLIVGLVHTTNVRTIFANSRVLEQDANQKAIVIQ